MSDTTTSIAIRQLPAYMQDYDEALLAQIFGSPDEDGVLQGGIMDAEAYPDLFKIPDYEQASRDPLQDAVYNTFDTAEERQAFLDRSRPYFTDSEGRPRYLTEASGAFSSGEDAVSDAVSGYLPKAQKYLESGLGSVGAKSVYDTELGGAKSRADQGTQSFDAQQRANALLQDARGAIQGGLGEFDPSSVSQFMNPYKEQVIDAAMDRINREGAQRRQGDAAKALGSGAFGGSRAGVQAAETSRAVEEAKQSTIANLMSQGYDKSLASAQQAYESAAKRGIAGGQQLGDMSVSQLGAETKAFSDSEKRMLQAADMYRSMGLSSADAQVRASQEEKKRNMEAGRLTGGLGATAGQLGGQLGNIGRGYGALAGTSANIGSTYSAMAPSDLSYMYNLGAKERQSDQQLIDFDRRNQLAYTQQALAPYSYAQNFLTGAPSASMYGEFAQQPSNSPNPFLQGVGMYATYQGLNRPQAQG